jgi:hypothetical protein
VSEDAQERHHRQLDELLTEIRVVLPGVQVLFAFLLSLPFLASFHSVTAAQRIIYFISFLATTVAMALLIVPPAFHRMRFEQHQKANIIHTGTRFALLALALLAVAVVGVVYVVTDGRDGGAGRDWRDPVAPESPPPRPLDRRRLRTVRRQAAPRAPRAATIFSISASWASR